MNKKDKISIIVCAYNTEKYISKCLDSILNQNFKNIEIMIVNDKSDDVTKSIIEEYTKKDSRIVFIDNNENKGLSYSRNIALKKSTGNYIGYIDSDDYVEPDYYKKLLKNIKDNDSDISVCDINLLYENTNESNRVTCGNIKNEKIDFINNGLAASACNKLFKREIIEQYQFSEGKVNEDLAVIIPLLIKSKVSYEESVVYNYVQRDNSIQNSTIAKKRFDIFYGVDLTLDRIKDCNDYESYKDVIIFQQIILLLLYVLTKEKNIFKLFNWLRIYKKLSKKYDIKNNKYFIEFINNLTLKNRIYYKLLIFFNQNNLNLFAAIEIFLYRIYRVLTKRNVVKQNITLDDVINCAKMQSKLNDSISLSVVIPNYNYEKFLLQRLYSILNQNVKIKEVIVLDDCSKDNSRELIDKLEKELKKFINIKKVYNKENSGSAFKQWQKGFELATSDYVWIAEADDYCDNHLLENLIEPIKKDKDIYISYSDTAFINTNGNVIMKSIVPEIDIMKTGHWNSDFIDDGIYEYNNYSFLNCTLANVSSAIIKKDNYKKYFELSGKYKQAGDWLFYVNVMRKGKIAYTKKVLNYYRVHGNNVSSTMKKEAHLKEIQNIHKYYRDNYGLNKFQEKEIKKRYEFLKKVWKLGEK